MDNVPPDVPSGATGYEAYSGMETPPGPTIILSGQEYLYFAGTGYHCLQGHPELIAAAAAAMKTYGMGTATGVRNLVGPSPVHQALEKSAAGFFGTEDAVCIATGYMANIVGISGLTGRFHRLFVDEISHYSVLDAARLAGKPVILFAHRDSRDLQRKLNDHLEEDEIPLLVSDGIFPTFGEIAPVDRYLDLLAPYGGLLWLDDAHAVGVIGPRGRGTLDFYGVAGENRFFGGSLAKAIGGHGGVIPGTRAFCDRIREHSGFLKGATGISVPAAAASRAGLAVLRENPQLLARLGKNSQFFKAGIRELGIAIPDSPHPVVAFSLGSAERNRQAQRELMRHGILIQHSTYVGAGKDGVLRMVIFSQHTEEQMTRLLDALRTIVSTSPDGKDTR